MYLIIIPILIFAITCLCLPQLMIQFILGFVGYIICKVLSNRYMAKMIVAITILASLNIVMEKVIPIIEIEQEKQKYIENRIENAKKYVDPNSKLYNKEDIQKPIDKIIDNNIPDNLFFRILTEYPRTR